MKIINWYSFETIFQKENKLFEFILYVCGIEIFPHSPKILSHFFYVMYQSSFGLTYQLALSEKKRKGENRFLYSHSWMVLRANTYEQVVLLTTIQFNAVGDCWSNVNSNVVQQSITLFGRHPNNSKLLIQKTRYFL